MYYAHISAEMGEEPKRYQTCTQHVRATAAQAGEILAPLGLETAGYLAGLLHDCGKYTAEFQAYLMKASCGEKVKRGSVIHTFAGVRCLLMRFHAQRNPPDSQDFASEILAVAVAGHHGLMDIWDEQHRNGFDHRLDHQPEYDERAIRAFHEECADEREIQTLYHRAEREITDFLMKSVRPYTKTWKEFSYAMGLLVRLMTSAVTESDRTDTRCFMQNTEWKPLPTQDWAACADSIRAYISAFPQETPIQAARSTFSNLCAEAAEQRKGLYRLDLPTGGGKTLAALRFAVLHARRHGMKRIFYIAPLLSIIEQNADEIRRALQDTAPVLEHHSDLLREELTPEEAGRTEWLQETWEAPVVITTLVQMLNTLFSGKMSSVRRFHSLCESVIILDEVQSLPPKMISMFNCAVNFLVKGCGATVVLCSATQPAFAGTEHPMLTPQRLISEDIFRQYAPLFRRTRIEDAGNCSAQELAEAAKDMLKAHGSLLIVCNTKREARELYERLAEAEDARMFHLSAGMCMAHRKAVLKELTQALEAQERLICVSTQVIEAGIDVSFDAVIRLSAGLDSVVQAAGRCNRHGMHSTPQPVRIYRLKEEKLGQLREIRQGQDALQALLAEYRRAPTRYDHDLASDKAVRDYYRFLYQDMPRNAKDYPTHGQTLYELLSTNSQFAVQQTGRAYFLGQAFRTAGEWFEVFDNDSESLLVPYQQGADIIARLSDSRVRYDMAYAGDLLTQSKPYRVSMPKHQMERMMDQGMVYTLLEGSLYVLYDGYYDDQVGIKEGKERCGILIV